MTRKLTREERRMTAVHQGRPLKVQDGPGHFSFRWGDVCDMVFDSPEERERMTFNHGYHDATDDVLRRKLPRNLVAGGSQTLMTVSREYSEAYYLGYRAGLVDAEGGSCAGNSNAAWEFELAHSGHR